MQCGLEWPLRKKKFQKNFSHQKTFYFAQMNGGLEKKFLKILLLRPLKNFQILESKTGFELVLLVEISEVLEAIFSKNFFSRPAFIWAN